MIGLKGMARKVGVLLKKHPHLKDDDKKLISNVWHGELLAMGKDPNMTSAFELLRVYSSGQLSNAETIRRSRQKIQELYPELRGTTYKNRTQKATIDVVQQLRSIK